MCCSDGVPQGQQSVGGGNGPSCTSPENLNGYCINVRECPKILDEFIKRRQDPEYVRYIQSSNANCNYASQAICCPNEASQPSQPSQPSTNLGSRLGNPGECGVSKVPHNRVVGGVPAKKGE